MDGTDIFILPLIPLIVRLTLECTLIMMTDGSKRQAELQPHSLPNISDVVQTITCCVQVSEEKQSRILGSESQILC